MFVCFIQGGQQPAAVTDATHLQRRGRTPCQGRSDMLRARGGAGWVWGWIRGGVVDRGWFGGWFRLGFSIVYHLSNSQGHNRWDHGDDNDFSMNPTTRKPCPTLL